MKLKKFIILGVSLLLSACGGGGSSSNSSTTVNSCPDGSTQVSFADIPKVLEAAENNNVAVEDHSSDPAPDEVVEPLLNQEQALRTGGVIIASCGGTVIANDSEDNDIVNGAQRLIAEIQLGRISKIEIYKGE